MGLRQTPATLSFLSNAEPGPATDIRLLERRSRPDAHAAASAHSVLFIGGSGKGAGGHYTCMMTQLRKQQPTSPKQASTCCSPIDDLLNPDLFKALCDRTRVRLLACLAKCGRGCSVSEVAECCSVDFSVVSRHLQLLERAGVLESTRAGRTVIYSVRYADLCRTLRALADAVEECCPADEAAGCTGGCCGNR